MPAEYPLGRRVPPSFDHAEKYPLATVATAPAAVNRVLTLPHWHRTHNQQSEGSCVGHAAAMERAITNLAQNRLHRLPILTRRYNPIDIWREAKRVDGDPGTDPGNDSHGTYVHSAYDVLRDLGAWRVKSMRLGDRGPVPVKPWPKRDPAEGVATNRWARSSDEMRAAIAEGIPVVIGVNWYSNFDRPVRVKGEDWIGRGDLGRVRGGHAVCVYGASDRREAFRVVNSWGDSYPLVWLPYRTMDRLLGEYGEAVVAVDR